MVYLAIAALLLVAIFIALTPRISPALYSKMIFHPQSDTQSVQPSLPYEDVFFTTADGVTLHGMFFDNPATDVALILSHGNAGTLPGWGVLGADLVSTGASVLVYDYRGFGKSAGSPTLEGIIKDGLAAHDFLVKDRRVSAKKIIPIGWSIGSVPTSRMAVERPCGAVVYFGAFASFNRLSFELMPFLKRIIPFALAFSKRTDNARSLLQVDASVPVLIAQAGNDELISMGHANTLLQAAQGNKELLILPDCTHANIVPGKALFFSHVAKLVDAVNTGQKEVGA